MRHHVRCLLVAVRFHEGRYHGQPDWPPSPARLFQALVAGAVQGETLADEDREALEWLESLDPPVIAAPRMRRGQSLRNFVPNNDLDAVGNDPGRVSEIRAPKQIRPVLFDAETPLLYLWNFAEHTEAFASAVRIAVIADRLYQLGRGVDMAWAVGEILTAEEAERRLVAHGGAVHRLAGILGQTTLAVPVPGSLASVLDRYRKMRGRFQTILASKPTAKQPDRKVPVGQVFMQAPRPRFREVAYDSPPIHLLFDLEGGRVPWPMDRIVYLTERVRDAAASRLIEWRQGEADKIRNVIVGRRDAGEADKAARIRIVALPSIGHPQADRAIRRILVELPSDCPLREDDVEWAFSGLPVTSADGEVLCELVTADQHGMLTQYGVGGTRARLWRTVTPMALPLSAGRRRIDPAHRQREAKNGGERAEEETKAGSAVRQAFRHAGVSVRPEAVRVQREPFEARGSRAEAFASGPRFPKERLWHVEAEFETPLSGPLLAGDGRFLGLGIMAPVRSAGRDIMAFALPPGRRVLRADREDFLRAVRRALMALSRDSAGKLPPLFSGHEPTGGAARSGGHRHVFLAALGLDHEDEIDHLVVAAPWACDRSQRRSAAEAALFDQVVSQLRLLRAGRLGVIELAPCAVDSGVTGPSRFWQTYTDYRPTRHAGRGMEPGPALLQDALAECERRRLPKPRVDLIDLKTGPKGGLMARLHLSFGVAVPGPIMLGRDSHRGGGLFLGQKNPTSMQI